MNAQFYLHRFSTEQKRLLVAKKISLHFGWLGGHYYYLEQWDKALLYSLLFWTGGPAVKAYLQRKDGTLNLQVRQYNTALLKKIASQMNLPDSIYEQYSFGAYTQEVSNKSKLSRSGL